MKKCIEEKRFKFKQNENIKNRMMSVLKIFMEK